MISRTSTCNPCKAASPCLENLANLQKPHHNRNNTTPNFSTHRIYIAGTRTTTPKNTTPTTYIYSSPNPFWPTVHATPTNIPLHTHLTSRHNNGSMPTLRITLHTTTNHSNKISTIDKTHIHVDTSTTVPT